MAGLHPLPSPHGAHHRGRRRKRAGRRHVKVAGAKRQREGGRRRATRHRSARARHAHDRRICERCHTRCTWEKSEEDAVCTKLRSGVLVGLPPGHRRQAVKCPRAPFSWKPSAESEKKSALVCRRDFPIIWNRVVGALSPVARREREWQGALQKDTNRLECMPRHRRPIDGLERALSAAS